MLWLWLFGCDFTLYANLPEAPSDEPTESDTDTDTDTGTTAPTGDTGV